MGDMDGTTTQKHPEHTDESLAWHEATQEAKNNEVRSNGMMGYTQPQ